MLVRLIVQVPYGPFTMCHVELINAVRSMRRSLKNAEHIGDQASLVAAPKPQFDLHTRADAFPVCEARRY